MGASRPTSQLAAGSRDSEPAAPDEPRVALERLTTRLRRLTGADEIQPERALELTLQVERSGRALIAALRCGRPLDQHHTDQLEWDELWAAYDAHLTVLMHAYRWCLEQCDPAPGGGVHARELALAACLALRACATRMKLCHLRYVPIEAARWDELIRVYLACESVDLAQYSVALDENSSAASCAEQEFLKALALALSVPSGLLPAQVEIAEALISSCVSQLALVQSTYAAVHHFVDLDRTEGPQRRSASTRVPATARGIDLSRGRLALQAIHDELARGAVTAADLGLKAEPDHQLIAATLRHVLRQWDRTLPERRHARHRELARVAVVHDFDAVVTRVTGAAVAEVANVELEHWIGKDRSESGLLAVAAPSSSTRTAVGALLAYRYPDRQVWQAGIVRRVQVEEDGARLVAVETLTTGPASLQVRPQRGRKGTQASEAVRAIYLVDVASPSRETIQLLLPAGTFSAAIPLEMHSGHNDYLLVPQELLESGPGYQIARFKLLKTSTAVPPTS